MKAYRIKDGTELFETYETGKLKTLSWVPLPNRHDGKGYRRLLRLQQGPLFYAAWIGMLTVASKCKPRWILADADGPLTAEDLSIKTDIPAEVFEAAIKALITKEIGWLEEVDLEAALLESAVKTAERAGTPARREGKGRERKKEMKAEKPARPDSPPSIEEEIPVFDLDTNSLGLISRTIKSGGTEKAARDTALRLVGKFGRELVLDCVLKMEGRQFDNPAAYLTATARSEFEKRHSNGTEHNDMPKIDFYTPEKFDAKRAAETARWTK